MLRKKDLKFWSQNKLEVTLSGNELKKRGIGSRYTCKYVMARRMSPCDIEPKAAKAYNRKCMSKIRFSYQIEGLYYQTKHDLRVQIQSLLITYMQDWIPHYIFRKGLEPKFSTSGCKWFNYPNTSKLMSNKVWQCFLPCLTR